MDNNDDKYRSVFDNIVDEIIIADISGKILDVNERCFDIFGYTREEVIGKNFLTSNFIKKGDVPKIVELISKTVNSENNHQIVELEGIHKDGHVVYTEVRANIIKEQSGVRIFAIIRDISGWKMIQDENLKMAEVVRNSPNLINIALPDGKMIFLNKSGQLMLGIDETEVQNHNILEVIDSTCMDVVNKELLPKLQNKEGWEGELKYKNLKTGLIFQVFSVCFPILDTNNHDLLYVANISNNITKQKQTEKELLKEMNNLKIINETIIDREMKMIELKKRIKELETKLAEK